MRSFGVGVVVGLVAALLITIIRRHGWDAHPRRWWGRVKIEVMSDWLFDGSGWDIDLLRLQVFRNHQRGTLQVCTAFVGIHLHVAALVNASEPKAYMEERLKQRADYLDGLPPQVRAQVKEMMQGLPLDANIAVAPLVTRPDIGIDDDDADDDDDKVH